MITPSGVGIGLIFGIVFLIAGLAFKVSAVPFHMWTPDVYEGAPTPITAFFDGAPRWRRMACSCAPSSCPFPHAICINGGRSSIFISVLSMALGAVAAIGQKNIKRLMAYSSIGHMGYALLGLAAGTRWARPGVLIYLAIYLVHQSGRVRLHPGDAARRRSGGDDLRSGGPGAQPPRARVRLRRADPQPGRPAAFAGFFAKFYVFLAAIQAHLLLARRASACSRA